MRPSHLVVFVVTACLFAGTAQATTPYGPAPESLTWRQPPMIAYTVEGYGVYHKGSKITELDVWINDRTYRLRQVRTAAGTCFTKAHSRKCLAAYEPTNQDVYNYTSKKIVVYGWAS